MLVAGEDRGPAAGADDCATMDTESREARTGQHRAERCDTPRLPAGRRDATLVPVETDRAQGFAAKHPVDGLADECRLGVDDLPTTRVVPVGAPAAVRPAFECHLLALATETFGLL